MMFQADINALIVTSMATAHVMDVPYNVKPSEYHIDIFDVSTTYGMPKIVFILYDNCNK